MWRILMVIFTGFCISGYFYPFSFTFLPQALNVKVILASLGVLVFVKELFRGGGVTLNRFFGGAVLIVLVFSLIGYVSSDLNNTYDYSYANYFISFATWTFGAVFICFLMRLVHGIIDIPLITTYLAVIGMCQCILALIISLSPEVKLVIDTYIDQGQGFLNEIGRWYGLGAALDPAGVRFSITLILIAGVIVENASDSSRDKISVLLFVCLLVIVILGNVISRTTSVGALMGFAYIFIGRFRLTREVSIKVLRMYGGLILLLTFFVFGASYLYLTDSSFYESFRYGFEGFFKWIETGEWTTDSTEKLNNEMWVWPEDIKTWVIGSGIYENWFYGTDIGYCRFILYNGLVGFSTFAFLFVYLPIGFSLIEPKYWKMFFLLLCLSFIIWIKVSTDIYQIWAMFFAMYFLSDEDEITAISHETQEEVCTV